MPAPIRIVTSAHADDAASNLHPAGDKRYKDMGDEATRGLRHLQEDGAAARQAID